MLNVEWYKSRQILDALRVSIFKLHLHFLRVRHVWCLLAIDERRQA